MQVKSSIRAPVPHRDPLQWMEMNSLPFSRLIADKMASEFGFSFCLMQTVFCNNRISAGVKIKTI